MKKSHVVIIGGGFAGLAAAKGFAGSEEVDVTLIDRRNYHLFQPLLYQVAMAGLSPAEIAAPIRGLLSRQKNVRVLQAEVKSIDFEQQLVDGDFDDVAFDYLIMACGATHSYFGKPEWEEFAPGLKTLEQATEIRRRVLSAFEKAECEPDPERQRQLLTFVVIGGGPTGVELAGAIGEMSRHTLSRDFRRIDSSRARIILVEGGPRILPMFSADLSARATRDLEALGVQVWTSCIVSDIDGRGVSVGDEQIRAATVLWAAGVEASSPGRKPGVETDRAGRIVVREDLSVPGYPRVFVAGDQAHFLQDDQLLPGVAPVAMQQGRFLARNILRELRNEPRESFRYTDKGKMATIGRSKAITEVGRWKISGFSAWLTWLFVHIYYLTGFRNRLFVVLSWAWSYLTWRRGARLIVETEWRSSSSADRQAVARVVAMRSDRPSHDHGRPSNGSPDPGSDR